MQQSCPIIDVHSHVLLSEARDMVLEREELQEELALSAKLHGPESSENNQKMISAIIPKLLKPELRFSDMKRMGVDMQVITVTPSQYYYWADAPLASELVEKINSGLVKLQNAYPDKFICLGTVSLQHPELAADQLRGLMENTDLKGIQISTSVEGRELTDTDLEPFWAVADELDAVVSIHPFGCATCGSRLTDYYLQNIIGQPLETTVALSKMIASGFFDQFPNVRVLSVHGGGYLPSYVGRMDHAHNVRGEYAHLAQKPSMYLKKIYFDSLVFSSGELAALVTQVGLNQVVMGSDYPFDMGNDDPAGHIRATVELDEAAQSAILSTNAMQLFRLEGNHA